MAMSVSTANPYATTIRKAEKHSQAQPRGSSLCKWLVYMLLSSVVTKADAFDPLKECPVDRTTKNEDLMGMLDLQIERRLYESLWKSPEEASKDYLRLYSLVSSPHRVALACNDGSRFSATYTEKSGRMNIDEYGNPGKKSFYVGSITGLACLHNRLVIIPKNPELVEKNKGQSLIVGRISIEFGSHLPSTDEYKQLIRTNEVVVNPGVIGTKYTTSFGAASRDVLHETLRRVGLCILGESHNSQRAEALMLQSSANTTAGVTQNGRTVVHFDEIRRLPPSDTPNLGRIIKNRPLYYELPDLEGGAGDIIKKLNLASSDLYLGKDLDVQALWDFYDKENIKSSPHAEHIKAIIQVVESQQNQPVDREEFARKYITAFETLSISREVVWTTFILNTTQQLKEAGVDFVTLLRVGSAHANRLHDTLKSLYLR